MALQSPHQLLSPPPSPAPQNLSTEINTATRQVHTRLNKLITSRLPLALPPLAPNPLLYAHGINNFGDVYLVFETCWQFLIAETNKLKTEKPTHEQQVKQWLSELIPPGLWRSNAIKKDVEDLENITRTELEAPNSDKLQTFTEQIHIRTRERPHVLVAYSWIMYMAIFSGGRWIREQLRNAGPEFWGETTDAEKIDYWIIEMNRPGFSMFYFTGRQDGEDIKTDFKARLEKGEALLTEKERKEIVEEGQFIFEQCIAIVEGLDEQLKTDLELVKILAKREETNDKSRIKSKASLMKVGNTTNTTVRAMIAAVFAVAFYYFYRLQHGHEGLE